MNTYRFFYDESEHSREINQKTICAANYYDNYIAAIVGWETGRDKEIEGEYLAFESKYSYRMSNGELKSSSIKPKELRIGFASMNRHNVEFLQDFLSTVEKASLYFCVMSKIEYVVHQLFLDYHSSWAFNAEAMKYSITKILNVYKPLDVIDCIYNHPEQLVETLENFFFRKIEENKANLSLKERENKAMEDALVMLEDVSPISTFQWEYRIPFHGFQLYLNEKGIKKYSVVIDKEGEKHSTLNAAVSEGIENVREEDSKAFFGIRMADMMAGLIGKLMKSLCMALTPSPSNGIQKTILSPAWFALTEEQLKLYKQLHRVINILDHCWYKAYAGVYSDDLVSFIALLNYMDRFSNADEMKKDYKMHGEYYNGSVVNELEKRYSQI